MSRPRPTIRVRLTALYALLVGASTGVLLFVSYRLLEGHFERTLPDDLADGVLGEVAAQYVVAFAGVLLLAAAVGWAVAGRLLAPLKRITGTARRVSDERLDERIPVAGADDELRELAETLNSMLDRLAESFHAQRRFVANASHELRSPLTVIRSEAEVALANPEPDLDELRAMAGAVAEASARTDALLASLLLLARGERGVARCEWVDLAATAARAAARLEPGAATEGVELRLELGPAVTAGDGPLLERLVENLLENAIRYNRPGGFVLLATDSHGGLARVRVENTGPPVAPDAAARLAEPFERLGRSADSRGAGLGLSIVRAICSAHGGSLSIDPRAGGGLEVGVALPTSGAAPATGSHPGRAPARV